MELDVKVESLSYYCRGAVETKAYLVELLQRDVRRIEMEDAPPYGPDPVVMTTINREEEIHEWRAVEGWYLRVGKAYLAVPFFRELPPGEKTRSIQLIILLCDMVAPTNDFVSSTVLTVTVAIYKWTDELLDRVFANVRHHW